MQMRHLDAQFKPDWHVGALARKLAHCGQPMLSVQNIKAREPYSVLLDELLARRAHGHQCDLAKVVVAARARQL